MLFTAGFCLFQTDVVFDGLSHQLQDLSALTTTKVNGLEATLEKILCAVEKQQQQCQPASCNGCCTTCMLPKKQSETDIYISRTEKRKQINFLSRDVTSTVVQHRSALSSCKSDQSVPIEDQDSSPSDIFQSQAMDLYSSTHCIQMKTPEYQSPLWDGIRLQGSGSRCQRCLPSQSPNSFALGQQFTLQKEARISSSIPGQSLVKSNSRTAQKTQATLQDSSRRKTPTLSRATLKSGTSRSTSIQQHLSTKQEMRKSVCTRTRNKRKFGSADSNSSEDEVSVKKTRNLAEVRRPCAVGRCLIVDDDAFLSSPVINANSQTQVSSYTFGCPASLNIIKCPCDSPQPNFQRSNEAQRRMARINQSMISGKMT